MSKTSQKGFSAVIALVVVVVTAGLAFGGWYVWNKDRQGNNANKPDSKSSQTDQNKGSGEDKQPDPYEGWKAYSNSNYGISFRYPVNWEADEVPPSSANNAIGGKATTVEYAVNLTRDEEVKYNTTASVEVLTQDISRVAQTYDSYFAQSSSNNLTRTTDQLKGRQSVQYTVTNNSIETKLYLFSVGIKTYIFTSINEELNAQTDADYWTKFGKTFDSLQIVLPSN